MDRKWSFLVGGVYARNEERLGSSMTNVHARAARAFASVSGCKQMVTEPTHIDGGVLDLVLTDVPDVIRVRVGLPGTSNHCAVFMNVVPK